MSRIPVTVLTGFLGSGKTTLLNRILSENHGQRIAVIENEFGEIGIDQALVINADEEVFEMNNGCICCTVRGDLIRILGNLMKRRDKFDRVLVETTGMADPGPVAQTFFVDDDLRELFVLDGIVTLVDAKHVSLHLDDSSECREQIAFADVLLLNKVDLVSSGELDALERRVRRMNAMARVHRTTNAAVPIETVTNVGGFDLGRALSEKPSFLEPEFPFEWAGTFELDAGTTTLLLDDGPDPTLDLVIALLGGDENAHSPSARERAARAWSRADARYEPDTTLPADGSLARLGLEGSGTKRFDVRIEHAGRYGIYLQHLAGEFNFRCASGASELRPLTEQEFAKGHTHDEQVTSVGIHLEGALDGDKLQRWISLLLRENGTDIFRMKGILNLRGSSHRYVFQGVHMLFDGKEDRLWGKDTPTNDMVFIGRGLDRAALVRGFEQCLA